MARSVEPSSSRSLLLLHPSKSDGAHQETGAAKNKLPPKMKKNQNKTTTQTNKTPNPKTKASKPQAHYNPKAQLSRHKGAAGVRKKASWKEAGVLLCSSASSEPLLNLAPKVYAIKAPHIALRSKLFLEVAVRRLFLANKARMLCSLMTRVLC